MKELRLIDDTNSMNNQYDCSYGSLINQKQSQSQGNKPWSLKLHQCLQQRRNCAAAEAAGGNKHS